MTNNLSGIFIFNAKLLSPKQTNKQTKTSMQLRIPQ